MEEGVQIEWEGGHLEISVFIVRPEFAWTVRVEFQAVSVGIAQIKGLADSVIAGAIQRDFRFAKSAQRIGKSGAVRIKDC